MARSVWTVVVAAGRGRRFGGEKQYAPLGGGRVLDRAVAAAGDASDGVVAVVPREREGEAVAGADAVVAGGVTRSASVRAGLAAVPAEAEVVVVHDAARPLASSELFTTVVEALGGGADGAVPALPVVDTVKQVGGDGVVRATLDRSGLVSVQTPQAFRADALRRAHAAGGEASDDAALVERDGGRVVVVPGEEANAKLTAPDDLAAAERRLARSPTTTRVGLGFDVHPWSDDPARPLVIGGVELRGERGLAGHSDADVVTHAVIDALLGAAGLGDIGTHFPDTDPALAGTDSLALLDATVALLARAGWRPGNVDCTVVLDAPRLAPHRAAMQEALSDAAGTDVSVKAARAEGLGALGRGEGVACWAVAAVER
jgi:2-C-methyl-D-erythritol 4-phosphate cytidylyltransferase/2-C-methyl-D-erythritol 2,4-cyclodiphosphate synthase